jgi:hypothetical protein
MSKIESRGDRRLEVNAPYLSHPGDLCRVTGDESIAHSRKQKLAVKGFAEDFTYAFGVALILHLVAAGNQENRQVWLCLQGAIPKFEAINAGNSNIADEHRRC